VSVVSFESWEESLSWTGDDAGFTAELLYDDIAATTYRTDIEFDVGDNAYRSVVAPLFGAGHWLWRDAPEPRPRRRQLALAWASSSSRTTCAERRVR
jgi:hypothetical protein